MLLRCFHLQQTCTTDGTTLSLTTKIVMWIRNKPHKKNNAEFWNMLFFWNTNPATIVDSLNVLVYLRIVFKIQKKLYTRCTRHKLIAVLIAYHLLSVFPLGQLTTFFPESPKYRDLSTASLKIYYKPNHIYLTVITVLPPCSSYGLSSVIPLRRTANSNQ